MKRETDLLNLISTYITSWLDKPFKFSGLAILLALFFASCEEPLEAPSSKLVPNDNNTNLKYIELPLEASQAAFDTSIVSSNNYLSYNGNNLSGGIIYFGENNDSEIGQATLRAYAGLALESGFNRSDSISSSSQLVNARLILRFNYLYGSDFGLPQEFSVNQLTDTISLNGHYYSIYDSIGQGEKISLENTQLVNPNNLLSDTRTDSIVIKLSNSFGSDIIEIVSNENLSSQQVSQELKGILIKSVFSGNTIYGIDLRPSRSYVELAFKKDLSSVTDTLKLNLTTGSFTNLDFAPGPTIPYNYSSNRAFNLNTSNQIYFNDLLGIYPKVSLDNYFSFIDSLDYMIINRAELVVGQELVNISTKDVIQEPPSLLFPFFIENDSVVNAGQSFSGIQSNFSSNGAISSQSGVSNHLALRYSTENGMISGDISFFLQELFDKDEFWPQDRSILLSQFINPNPVAFDERAIFLIGNYNNFLINSDDIKLRIYYTTFEN